IDIGAMISMFACTLACVTAAARVLLMMSHNGLAHRSLARTHDQNATPHAAVLVTGLGTLAFPVALTISHQSGETIYDWMGSCATYGFIVVYALVAIALPLHLRVERKLSPAVVALSAACVLAMAMVLEGT